MIENLRDALKGGVARNLVTLFLTFGIIPIGLLAMIFFSFYFKSQKQSVSDVQKEVAARIAGNISAQMEKTKSDIQLFAHFFNPVEYPKRNIREMAYLLLNRGLEYDAVSIADLQGNEICKVSRYYTFRSNEFQNLAYKESFRLALQGRTCFSQVELSSLSGLPIVGVTVPILNLREDIVGVLEVGVNVSKMWEQISKYRIGENRYAYIIDSRGILIAYQEVSSILEKKDVKNILGARKFLDGEIGVYEYNGLKQDPVVGANAPIPLTGWGVIVEEPLAKALADLHMLSVMFIGIFVITGFLAIFLGLRFSFAKIVKPIRRLREEASIIAKGNFDRRIPVDRPDDELGQLCEAFNSMVSDLQNTTVSRDLLAQEIEVRKLAEEALKKERDQAQQYLDIAGVLLMVLNSEGRITVINRKGCKLLGYEEKELIGVNWFDVCLPGHMRHEVKTVFDALMAGDLELAQYYENPVITRSGTERLLSFHNTLIRDRNSNIIGVLSSAEDITEHKRLQKTLSESAELLKSILESTADGILAVDKHGEVVGANARFFQMWRIPGELMETKNDARLLEYVLGQLEEPSAFLDRVQALYASTEEDFDTLYFKDGRIFERFSCPLTLEGLLSGRVWSFRDVTMQRKAEVALRESEQNYREIFNATSDGLAIHDETGRFLDVNDPWLTLLGYGRDDLPRLTINDLSLGEPPYSHAEAVQKLRRAAEEGPQLFEWRCRRNNGELFWAEIGLLKCEIGGAGRMIASVRDVTERKRAEEVQRAALKEKEVLLREIHHRVKNNMQVISSLLSLQAEKLENEQVRQALLESRQRIVSMAMIHETLYSGKNLAAIDLAAYLKSLVSHLHGVYGGQADVRIALELDEVDLSIDQVVPCGLIINELITNSFKHAFPEGGGMIRVKTSLADGKEVVLEVSDNGVGLAEDADLANTSSLGLRLVQGLLKHQLKGSIEVVIDGGTAFTLRWPLPAAKEEADEQR